MVIYDSIIESAEKERLSVAERGQFYTAVIEYLYFGREPGFKMSKTVSLAFNAMKPVFNNQRASAANGRKGGRPRKNTNQGFSENGETENQGFPENASEEKPPLFKNPAFSENLGKGIRKGREKETPSSEGVKKSRAFTPPDAAEVTAYAASAGLAIDAQRFCDYFAAQGWKLSNGNPMRDWKAAVRNWTRRDGQTGRSHEFDEYD